METNIIYNEDCFIGVKRIEDKSVDLVITDPPYEFKQGGFGGGQKDFSNRSFKKELDKNELLNQDFDVARLMKEIERVCKKVNAVIFCNDCMLPKLLSYITQKGYVYSVNIWHKTNPIPYTNQTYLSDVEYCVHFRERGTVMYGDYHSLSKVYTSSVNKKDKEKYGHTTIKPLELVKKYLINHSKENDIVLDMYMGRGTTAVACRDMNRQFIGFEIDEKYYNVCLQRLEEKENQLELF
jgi:site-specific DNA-methyltransferase (adenine-specific)